MSIRVMHVIRNLDTGGVETGVVNLTCGLDRMGFKQGIYCFEGKGALSGRVPASVPVWAFHERQHQWRYGRIFDAARWMRAFRPHVVHARNCGAWIDGALSWILAGRPGRLVFSIHGLDWIGHLSKRRALLYRQLARLTYGLVAVSARTAEEFAQESGIPLQRFTVLHSGVDTRQFRPQTGRTVTHGGKERVVVGCVARLAQLKGHEILIPAFAEAVNYAKVDLELRLLGNGPFRQKLEELARACCVETRVRFLGESWDVAAQLRELDLFVLASLREGRPTSIMEAMASGLPVIATRVGAVPDLVVDGESGLLIDPSNVSGLANSILTLAHDPERRRRFGDAARKIAVEQLQIWRMVAGYEHFYKEMAA